LSEFIEFTPDGGNVSVFSPGSNTFTVFQDSGDIYRYGFEAHGCPAFVNLNATWLPSGAEVREDGPLRARFLGFFNITFPNNIIPPFSAQIEYSLSVGEPYLRVTVNSLAPSSTVVLLNLKIANGTINQIVYGTPYHWEYRDANQTFGSENGPVFVPTHNFVTTTNNNSTYSAVVYHGGDVGSWFAGDSNLVGAFWRNTPNLPCQGYGAEGTDPYAHTLRYALRVPGSLQAPATGQPLQESLGFSTPVFGLLATADSQSQQTLFPSSFTLASIQSPSSAIFTTAKGKTTQLNQLVLRVYQPTNNPQTINVTISPGIFNSSMLVTALEDPIGGTTTWAPNSMSFTYTAQYALSSVLLI